MRDRVKSLKRIVSVQRHLHDLEELRYVRLKQQLSTCEEEQRTLSEALSGEDALHGLFTDMTVRRLQSLRHEEARLGPLVDAQARVLREHGARLRNSERLSEELAVDLKRDDERRDLERLLEDGLAQKNASSKQDG